VDYSAIAISLLIVLYGIIEYRRREASHKAAMKHIAGGE
jgi:hypothetical protein